MSNSLITVWCLFSFAECFIVYRGVRKKEAKYLMNNSIFSEGFIVSILYIVAIIAGPVPFIAKLLKDLKIITKINDDEKRY